MKEHLVQFAHGVLTSSLDPQTTYSEPLPSFNPPAADLPYNPFDSGQQDTVLEPEAELQGADAPKDPSAPADGSGTTAPESGSTTADSAPAADAPAADAPAADAPAADAATATDATTKTTKK